MRLNQLTVAIKLVLKRPLFDEEKAVYEHKQLDFKTQVIKSARKFGRTQHILKEVEILEEKRRIICSTLALPRFLSGERNVVSDSVAAKELSAKAMNVPRSAGHRSGDFHSQATGYMTGKPRSIGHGPVSIINEHKIPRGTFEKVGSENPCDIAQRGRAELNAQYFKQQLDTEHLNPFNSFVEMVNKKPLEPWRKHFLELALRAKNAGESLTILPRPRGRKLVNLSVTICAFDVMRDLTQSEFEKAVLLRSELSSSAYNIAPIVNYYLDRAVFFAQLSQQTNNLIHITKAYKRAYLVCKVLRYFLKSKYFNLVPSERLRTAIGKGLYA